MAGVANKMWTMIDFVELLEREEQMLGGRLTDYKMAATVKAKKNSVKRKIQSIPVPASHSATLSLNTAQ